MVKDTYTKIEYTITNQHGVERAYTYNYTLATRFAKQVKNQEGYAKIVHKDRNKKIVKEEII